MSQAIVTSYVGPCNRRGSRISVKSYSGRRIFGWDDALGTEENHRQAAFRFANQRDWVTRIEHLVSAGMPKGDGSMVHIILEKSLRPK